MTIKKRLFISNILMIVIPVVVSIITILVCCIIFNAISGGALTEVITAEKEMRPLNDRDYNTQIVSIPFITLAGFIAIMYFTNRFLTRFVFRRIEQPLQMLSGGVHQISEGNLNYRIRYDERDEFKPVCDDFNNMAARLKASIEDVQKNEESRKELFAGISHDLRSPLTSIKAFVEGLIDGVASTSESQREYLQIIKQKTDDINTMVSQLFLYSKLDMGNYPVHPEPVDMGKELSDFAAAVTEEYKTKGLTVVLGDMPTGKYACADPLQLRSVFANILDNSAKYKTDNTATATIHCAAGDGKIRIVFEDDGPGVPKDALLKLFDVFYRNDPSRSNPQQGSGLGLAIAAKALEKINGGIHAENRAEGGMRLIVEIPEMRGERRA